MTETDAGQRVGVEKANEVHLMYLHLCQLRIAQEKRMAKDGVKVGAMEIEAIQEYLKQAAKKE